MPLARRPYLTTGGRGSGAEMPPEQRPRFILVPPQVRRNANQLPRQWEGSQRPCSNAALPSPFPTIQQGAIGFSQQCHAILAPALFWCHSIIALCRILSAPMGRVNHQLQQCQPVSTLPRLTTGSHPRDAAMLFINRSHFIWCRSARAEMPLYWRTNNQRPVRLRRNATTPSPRTKQGDPLWINVTKTQPLPRYI